MKITGGENLKGRKKVTARSQQPDPVFFIIKRHSSLAPNSFSFPPAPLQINIMINVDIQYMREKLADKAIEKEGFCDLPLLFLPF